MTTEDGHKFVRNKDFIFRQVAGEMILVPVQQDVADMDAIYTLNEVGAFIWQQLEGPVTLAELQSAVLNEFTAAPGVVTQDLQQFLQAMIDYGAVLRS